MQMGAECQARSQSRRMSQPPSLSDRCVGLCQCLVQEAETEKDEPQKTLQADARAEPNLMGERAVGDRIVKRKRLFQVRPGSRKPARVHHVSAGRQVAQDETDGIVALAAETQQILVQTLRPVEFATVYMIKGLPEGHLEELRGRTQLLP